MASFTRLSIYILGCTIVLILFVQLLIFYKLNLNDSMNLVIHNANYEGPSSMNF